jgi:hypothetical protein
MADPYTQLYVHVVLSVKSRHTLIPKYLKLELHKYITGIITAKKQRLIQINSMLDHTLGNNLQHTDFCVHSTLLEQRAG